MLRIEFLKLLHCDLTVTVLLHPWSLELEVYMLIGTIVTGKYSSHVTCIITVLLILSTSSVTLGTNVQLWAASNTIWIETRKDTKSWKVFHHWFSYPAYMFIYTHDIIRTYTEYEYIIHHKCDLKLAQISGSQLPNLGLHRCISIAFGLIGVAYSLSHPVLSISILNFLKG